MQGKIGIIENTFTLSEKQYLCKLVQIILVLYFTTTLSPREVEFFAVCMMGLRRGWKNINSVEFQQLFDAYYLNEQQTKEQKASLVCTMRKKLTEKDVLYYDKNTFEISVSNAWMIHFNELDLNIKLRIA